MRINRLRLRAQQAAIRAAQIKEAKVLQAAINNLTDTVTNMQAEVIAKQTGVPVVPVVVPVPQVVTTEEGKAIEDKIIDIREDVAEIKADVTAPITPQEARERAADLLADANAAEAEKKP